MPALCEEKGRLIKCGAAGWEPAFQGMSIPYLWRENPGKVKPFHPCAGSISDGSAQRAGRRPSSDPTVRTPLFKAECSLVWHYAAGPIPTLGRRSQQGWTVIQTKVAQTGPIGQVRQHRR
jgi:hypothetical protein